MALISFYEESKAAVLKNNSPIDNVVAYVVREKKGKPTGDIIEKRAEITIGEMIMADAGLRHGDKVDIMFDPDDGFAFITRKANNEKGFKIGKRKSNHHGHITLKWTKGMPYIKSSERIIVETKNHEIQFEFPPSSFDYLKEETFET